MTKRLLLLMAVAMLLTSAAPTYATYWGNNNWGDHSWGDWGDDWRPKDDEPKDEHECKWDDWFDGWDDKVWTLPDRDGNWGDRNWFNNDNKEWEWPSKDEIKEWLENHDWKDDWRDGGGEWHCDHHDDPIPEPATAGLAFMGMGALIAATRRRRK